jgi:hypothetical protein
MSVSRTVKTILPASLFDRSNTSLITVGLSGPDYDLGLVRDWVAWRDQQNAAS